MENAQETCTNEEFDYFMSQRHLLKENDVDGKVLRTKSADSTVGLLNHGSTCYLNAILQCLLQNASFLKALFSDDNSSNQIVSELKKQFGFMVNSTRNAVGTKDLLTSFGWNTSQIHDQHDAQEFYGILLDALSQSSPALEGKLQEVFRGSDSGKWNTTHSFCSY
jgi:ubiquitin C-terminal hydrolase